VEQAHLGTEQAGGVMEVTQENFWAVVAEAADRLVVLDMYTQW
jgi:thioredoxin-like negative regulator of GroEL